MLGRLLSAREVSSGPSPTLGLSLKHSLRLDPGFRAGRSSSISVTRAAIGERSERVSVTCANSGWPLQRLDHRGDAVVPTDAQVVALRDVVREHDARARPDPRQHRQQHVALERLRLVDDHERVVQRPAADVRQRQHLEHPAVDDLVDHVLRRHSAPSVSKTACAHGVIFSLSLPGR